MSFPDSVRNEALKKAHFMCVACHDPFVEVHHITPQSEGGADTLDNAAPLCPGCHGIYGGNPVFRNQIKQMRDNWYDVCQRRFGPSSPTIAEQLNSLVEALRPLREDQIKYQTTLDQIKTLLLGSLDNTTYVINRAKTFKDIPPFTILRTRDEVVVRQECPECGAITEMDGTPPDICSVCGKVFIR